MIHENLNLDKEEQQLVIDLLKHYRPDIHLMEDEDDYGMVVKNIIYESGRIRIMLLSAGGMDAEDVLITQLQIYSFLRK